MCGESLREGCEVPEVGCGDDGREIITDGSEVVPDVGYVDRVLVLFIFFIKNN